LIYTKEEIKELENHVFVKSVIDENGIEYDPVFKLWSVMIWLKFPKLTEIDIFEKAGFDMDILNKKEPRIKIIEWFKLYKMFGADYFIDKDTLNNKRKKQLLELTIEELRKLNFKESYSEKGYYTKYL